ncbi:hypothetical protein IAD21_04490 [Abditibacteriota bacterium]|nr:hypothetical protein IAD21_04490 [Abditibacteriota bacterium]
MKISIKKSLLGSIALLNVAATVQAAPTLITTAEGRGSDLQIRGGGFVNDNFGISDILRVRNSADVGNSRKSYFRFDLAKLPRPAKNATGVTLGLQLAPTEGNSPAGKVWTFNVSALKDGAVVENWDEKAVSWKNAPANDATSGQTLTADALPLGTFTITGKGEVGQQISFSSPELLKLVQEDSNGIVTLIITRKDVGEGPDNDVMHIFASKEYKTPAPPVLSVAFDGEAPALPTAAQWALLPVAAPVLPFESDIEAFEAADLKNPPAKGGIVFVGSSSIRRWETLAQDFPGLNVFNRGFGGSHIIDSAHFAQRIVTPYEPKMIVFYAGTNDLADGLSPEILLSQYMEFVSQVRAKLPNTPIAFISVAPAPSRWGNVANIKKFNGLVAEFSKLVPNLKFIDIFPLMLDAKGQPRPELFVEDQLHMKPAGYAIWVKAVEPFLPKP